MFLAQKVLHFAARISSVVVTWSLLAVRVGTLNAHGVCTISLQAAVHPLSGPHTTTTTTTTVAIYLLPISNRVIAGEDGRYTD
jgi:hypothetical protein